MNQNERDDLAIYLGLQDFEVKLVEVEGSRRRGQIKVLYLARRSGTYRCPECGREHAEGLFEDEPIRVRDSSIGDFETYLEVEPMRVGLAMVMIAYLLILAQPSTKQFIYFQF